MADAQKTIAAFAIDEHIRWASARVTGKDIEWNSITFGNEVEETKPGVIADQITDYVSRIFHSHPDVRHAQSIGVSTIGPVDVKEKKVEFVARKAWRARKPNGPVIDYKEVFSMRSAEWADKSLVVQNDATCAIVAESHFRKEPLSDKSLWLYITINAGVNCGILSVARPLLEHRHPELGHVFPAIHPHDPFNPDKHSGCPKHRRCFEGIASGDSMQKRWGDDWNADPRAWPLEASYVAQMCLVGMLSFMPDRTILGGWVTRKHPDFLRMVRAEFKVLNADYIRNDNLKDLESYISPGQFADEVNVRGALVLASDTVVRRPFYLV